MAKERAPRGLGRWFLDRARHRDAPESAPAPAAIAAAEIVDHAAAFSSLTVGDIMIPRADIVAVEVETSFAGVVAAFLESGHSRLPVYRGSLDDPLGVAYLKDVFQRLAAPESRPGAGEPVLRRLIRPSLYAPPSMRAADLLVRMRTGRIHMAMVIDEFGGLDGLVTLEDVIEAVVGEIDDEHDEARVSPLEERADGVFDVDGRLTPEELEIALGAPLASEELEEEVDTVAGLVTALAGRVPQRGEVIAHPAGVEFEIVDADPRRIRRLRVRRAPPKSP